MDDVMSAPSEILYWFRVTTCPAGGAPEAVRAQWIGTLLPVRQPPPIEGPESYLGRDVMDRHVLTHVPDGVVVLPEDALKALRFFGRDTVAEWWAELLAHRPLVANLVFRRREGELLPVRMAYMLHPELEAFDTSI